MIISDILQLIRIKDWFKNLIIFFPLIFTGRVLEFNFYQNLFVDFIAFSLSASFIYIINDIIDLNNDKYHPIKKNRPIVSGRFSLFQSILFLIILLVAIIIILINNKSISLHILTYLAISLLYILFVKKIPFIEMLILSFVYIIRIDSGSKMINVESSNLMLITTFIIAIFFISLKRIGELNLINNESNNTRYVLHFYNKNIMKGICLSSSLFFMILICIYIYNTNYFLIFTLPLILMFMYRYYSISNNSSRGENPINLILSDKFLFIKILVTFLILISVLLLN